MKKYVLQWWYYDGSGRGVLPTVFTEDQKNMIAKVLTQVGDTSCKEWAWVEVEEAQG